MAPVKGKKTAEGEVVRYTIDLPRATWTALRQAAAASGETMKDLVLRAIRAELRRQKP